MSRKVTVKDFPFLIEYSEGGTPYLIDPRGERTPTSIREALQFEIINRLDEILRELKKQNSGKKP